MEPIEELAEALRARLIERARGGELGADLAAEIAALVERETAALTEEERAALRERVLLAATGLGPLEELLADPAVDEVMVNGPDAIYVERGGRIEPAAARFGSEAELRHAIERILAPLGRRVDEAAPVCDARLADGSRVNVVIPPLSLTGPCLTIRRFRREGLSLDDLVGLGTLSAAEAELLARCVAARAAILVREARPPKVEGRGDVTIRALVRNALRMRPDRIVVGEVRGGEALDMLSALTTGHEGSLTTVHASSAAEALRRIETLALMADVGLPHDAIRDQVAAAIELVVHQRRLPDGRREIAAVAEVVRRAGAVGVRSVYEAGCELTRPSDGRLAGRLG
jgi:pilus assembly protein CpaF